MKEFISKWSNWWILNPRRKQLDDAFGKELNELIEREVALRIHDVAGQSEQLISLIRELIDVGIIDEDDIEVETWVKNYLKEKIDYNG